MGRVTWVRFFYVGQCVLREWVVRGGGLDGFFGEQGLPVGIAVVEASAPKAYPRVTLASASTLSGSVVRTLRGEERRFV